MDSQVPDRLRRAVAELQDELLAFASELIRIDTVNPPGSYDEIAPCVDRRFRAWGLESQIVDVPPDYRPGGPPRRNVIGTLRGQSAHPCLVLNPHLDTVPAGDPAAWKYPPFSGTIAEGRLWGRGACDCKGRLASFALAAAAIQRAGVDLKGTLVLAATADEETGGERGTGYLVERGYLDPDWVIMEGFINRLGRGCGGMLGCQIEFQGRSAHTSTPWLGINAIQQAAHAIGALEELQAELLQEVSDLPEFRFSSLNIGTIRGGVKESVVPAGCQLGIDMRLMPGHPPADILARIRGKLDLLAAKDPDFRYSITNLRTEEPYLTDADSPLVVAVQHGMQAVRGHTLPVVVGRGGSDAKYYIRRGIRTIGFGPGMKPDSMHHGVDEHIEIQDFVDASLVTALAAVELLS